MNLVSIARRNVFHRPLSTGLSVLLLAFGVGMISILLLVQRQLAEDFDRNINDIDMVLGAKGSPLQLILANVYHVDVPTGNISLPEAQQVVAHPFVESGIPLAYGDNYRMYRIVGTEWTYPEHYACVLAEGDRWGATFEVVLGAAVAKTAGMVVGDTFFSAHGLADETDVHDDKTFVVVGILERSGSVIDQLILTSIETVWAVHEHEGDFVDPADREITAMLLKKRNPLAILTLPNLLKDSNMQIALPSIELNRLTQQFGIGIQTIRAIALLIMVLSFVSVFIALFNSLRDRRYELALMRTMGGTPRALFTLVVTEGLWMTCMGIITGLILSRIGIAVLSSVVADQFHYDWSQMGAAPGEGLLVALAFLVGLLAAAIPARSVLKMDISRTLGAGR